MRLRSGVAGRTLWLVVVLAVASAGCDLAGPVDLPPVEPPFNCDETWPPSAAARSTPSDWDEAVDRIVGCLPGGEYQIVLTQSEAGYIEWAYPRLGLAIRNEWIRPEGSPLAANLRALGLEYPDDMSNVILSAVWNWVHGRRIDVRARVACTRAWNWEMQRLAREAPFGTPIRDPDFRCDDEESVREARPRWEAIGP